MRRIWLIGTLLLLTLPARAGIEIFFLHNDHLGTPRVITDKNRQVVWKGHMKPFGEMEVAVEVITNQIRFPGQRYDIESRLHYNYFRDYEPGLGRYIQSDPLDAIGRTSDPQLNAPGIYGEDWFNFNGKWYYHGLSVTHHPYGYAAQNPVIFVDPLGLHHKDGHGWNPPKAEHPLGYYVTQPNGNLFPGFRRQDWKCSVLGLGCLMDRNPEMLERCINHDQCFKDNLCNYTSRIGNALGANKPCNQCNSNF